MLTDDTVGRCRAVDAKELHARIEALVAENARLKRQWERLREHLLTDGGDPILAPIYRGVRYRMAALDAEE